jgi:transposase
MFRKPLSKALKRSDGSKGGRPSYDTVMMFKVLVLQALYSLSDDQAEFQIKDRLSFMRFQPCQSEATTRSILRVQFGDTASRASFH